MTDGMCQKWIAKCHAGDFSRAAAPRVGRPGAVESHAGQTLTEDRSHYSMGETGGILKVSESAFKNYLRQLGYVNCVDVWVLQKLSGVEGDFS